MNAFEVLGLSSDASQAQVRQAYHTQVKACHPDLFTRQEDQLRAQEQLVQLNLAYEQALRLSAQKNVGYASVPVRQAVDFARRLYEQGMFDGALRQLARAEQKTEVWYFLNGQILMKMKQYASAHQCFRAAVRFSPENREYRAWALDAALAMKKSQTLSHRVANWAGGLFRRK